MEEKECIVDSKEPDIRLKNDSDIILGKLSEIENMLLNIEGSNIQFIDNPTEEQCLIAINSDPSCIEHIKNITKEMLIKAIEIDPDGIDYFVSENFSEADQFDILYSSIGHTLARKIIGFANVCFKPDSSLYKTICEECVDHTPDAIQYVINPSIDMCKNAISRAPHLIHYVDQTYELCLCAVEHCNRTAYEDITRFIKDEFMTEELCIKAIKNGQNINLCRIPKITINIADALSQSRITNYYWISHVDEDEQTDELCELFIKTCPSNYWKRYRDNVRNKSFKIRMMKLMKTLGWWKVK